MEADPSSNRLRKWLGKLQKNARLPKLFTEDELLGKSPINGDGHLRTSTSVNQILEEGILK
jgi:hypothetical protein